MRKKIDNETGVAIYKEEHGPAISEELGASHTHFESDCSNQSHTDKRHANEKKWRTPKTSNAR